MKQRDKLVATGLALVGALLLIPSVGQGAFTGLDDGAIVQAASSQERPAAATPENIAMGKELYTSAKCVTCHGADGKGKSGMTTDMTNGEWKFAEGGAFDGLVKVITEGLAKAQTGGPVAMPTAASKDLTDAQVTALAAYVWSLNHPDS